VLLKYARRRAVLRAPRVPRLGVRGATQPHVIHRHWQEPPRAASSSTIPASLDRQQTPAASARLLPGPGPRAPSCTNMPVGPFAGTGDAAGAPRRASMVVSLNKYVLGKCVASVRLRLPVPVTVPVRRRCDSISGPPAGPGRRQLAFGRETVTPQPGLAWGSESGCRCRH
jgi:hypothetical protein